MNTPWPFLVIACWLAPIQASQLGLPSVPIPANNPQTAAKIALGDRLYHEKRFSSTRKVSCATCHEAAKGFTDNLRVSEGINALTGTRNAPTIINAAYSTTMFWDGREADLEAQSMQPFINPVEMALENHQAILKIVRNEWRYRSAFKKVFAVSGKDITMEHVAKAIASFERTIVAGNSAFDQWFYGANETALTADAKRGYEVFIRRGRCVSCHIIEQTQALFTDNRFHNIGVGFKQIKGREGETAAALLKQKQAGIEVDIAVLTQKNLSELGRFAVTDNLTEIGAFKTPTLRNIALTAPYMHDGSLATLDAVIDFYNNGGRVKATDPLSGFLSGGIRVLDLNAQEKSDLVAFLNALTSPNMAKLVVNARGIK